MVVSTIEKQSETGAAFPSVRVVMMQKDEGDVLIRWVSHYSGLFGFDNLVIVDNGSTDPLTKSVLQLCERQGSRVMYHLTRFEDWQYKGAHLRNIIAEFDQLYDYEFALPVDCDEFLAVFTAEGLSADHDAIRDEFLRLRGTKCALRLDMSLFNHPGRQGWFIPDLSFHKGFLPANSIKSIDHGQHDPQSVLQSGHELTRFTYLHMHNRSYEQAVHRAKVKLGGLVDTESRAALQSYLLKGGAHGGHLIGTLLASKEEYDARFDQGLQVYVGDSRGSANFLQSRGRTDVWDAEEYLALNPDVRTYGLTALHHYLRFGYSEERALSR